MNREVTYEDITGAVENRDPQLADLVVRYLLLPDPPEDRAEEAEQSEARPLSQDAWTLQKLRSTLAPYSLWGKSADEVKNIRLDAWEQLMAAAHPPPRLRLGDLLISIYERGEESDRSALVDIFRSAKLGWGVWRAAKHIYKQAEQRHDAELFGVLAWRLDVYHRSPNHPNEVSQATTTYMRRRAWRYLRQLGNAVPELYPQFAVQVLRHYERDFNPYGCWIIQQIWNHQALIGRRNAGWNAQPPDKLSNRAYDKAWKISAEPLLRLIEDSENDGVLRFATRSLEADFPETLREVDPAWLGRLGKKPAGSVHEFVVSLLEGSPEFHQSKLAGLGLHDMVLELLGSPSEKAAKYAIDYANAHGGKITAARLIELLRTGTKAAQKFAEARLEKLSPKDIGLVGLVGLLGTSAQKFAIKMIESGFTPADLSPELYTDLLVGGWQQRRWVEEFFNKHKQQPSAELLKFAAQSPKLGYWDKRAAFQALGSRKASEIGVEWIKQKLLDPEFSDEVGGWLSNGMLKGDQLDVEWLKGLSMNARLRGVALRVLGNTKLVAPKRVGLGWLLVMARQSDPELYGFARNHLLEHFEPSDFGVGSEPGAGLDRLWSMAVGKQEPESVRKVAQTYLLFHHPQIGPDREDPLHGVLEPKLSSSDYALERVAASLVDPRPDVRRFAAEVGSQELVRWGDRELVYRLAANEYKEPRKIGSEALLEIGEVHEGKPAAPVEWLVASRVFALAESSVKSSREVASALIRRHYHRLGGAAKLAWLMESPDREVRLFAVRLLWDQHRPLTIPASWKPKKGPGARPGAGSDQDPLPEGAERFETGEALRQFLRTVMFGLPPGRVERREPIEGLPTRRLSASEGKRRLIGVVRELAVEDREFATIAVSVLDEFMHSHARGEWQSCVAAIARIRQAHPDISTALPAAMQDERQSA
ncbi:hypothetical protein DB30_02722 [Enhygromyxa salina]|uniref:Uncharacterized protein n=1 Tax=Enhygromyxa salina TaxID=215803 RepID=A0A0C2D8L9_9BACT|nr:hypothetical protein [Enhygromyxa salina]KIG19441.1 hypothetical protein DB30_02722 [Enhygromyxa salina]